MRPGCPKCFAVVSYEEHGGLFSIRCPVCKWHEDGTVNRALFPAGGLEPGLVAKAKKPVSAEALKTIRDELISAKAISLAVLRNELTSENGHWVDTLPKYRADELRAKLSSVGIWLEQPPHEEG